MELTYDRMNRKLSIAAAVAQVLVIISVTASIFSWIQYTFSYWNHYDNIIYAVQSLISYTFKLFFTVALLVVLLRGKKDVLSGIFLLAPALYSGLSLAFTVVFQILPLPEAELATVSYGSIVLSLVGFVTDLIYRGVLATACFTRGRIFGQRFRIVLPIVAFGYVILDFLYEIFSIIIVTLHMSNIPFFSAYKELFELSLKNVLNWQSLITKLPFYAVVILTALAFLYPAKSKSTITEE